MPAPQRLGPYEIVRELGRGGMGIVYEARHPALARTVALKTLHLPDDDGSAVARFQREARAAAALADHPHIVGVHDVGMDDGVCWLAMDCVREGQSLDQWARGGDVAPMTIAALGAKVARALAHAHRQGILHRDVKPANILVDADGEPHLADFGLAKHTAADAELTRLTQSGDLLGTPAYMAPEQARGETVDARADVYALGATLYEALAGDPPFRGDSVTGVLVRALREPAPPLRSVAPHVPPRLAAIVEQCLEKRPEDRYVTADALADDLERYLRGDSVVARRPALTVRAGRWVGRHRLTVTFGAVAVVSGVVSAGWWWRTRERDVAQRDELAQVTTARDVSDRAGRLDAAYAGLLQRTTPALQALENHFHGERRGTDPRPGALSAVEAAVQALADQDPDLRLPLAWFGLARFLAGEESAGLELLDRAVLEAGDDPFPAVLTALALLERYVRDAELPSVGYLAGEVRVGEFEETDTMRADRDQALALLTPLVDAPIWQQLSQGRSAPAFAAAVVAMAEGRYADVAEQLTPLVDDPVLGASAGQLRGIACYLCGRFPESGAAFAPAGARGWARALRRAGVAFNSEAVATSGRGADATPWFERAIACFERAVTIAPRMATYRVSLGVALAGLGDLRESRSVDPVPTWTRALDSYTGALEFSSRDALILSNRGRVHRSIGDWIQRQGQDPMPHYERALADLERACALAPDYVSAQRNRGNCCKAMARWQRDHRDIPGAIQRYRAAIAAYDRAAEGDPSLLQTFMSRGSGWSELAVLEARSGRDVSLECGRAVADITRWLDAHPEDAQAFQERGEAHVLYAEQLARARQDPQPQWEAASSDFAKAHTLEPGWVSPLRERGRALRDRGRWRRDHDDPAGARADFTQAVADLKEAASRTRDLKVRLSLGAARQTLAGALEAAGEDPVPQYRAAEADFTDILAAAPRYALAWQNRGIIRWNLAVRFEDDRELFTASLADFTSAAQLDDALRRVEYWRGRCFEKLGRLEDARAAYRAELARNPRDRDAPRRLQALEGK